MEKTEQQTPISDWRDEVSDSALPVLKIQDGQNATFVFLTEGKKNTHPDYGTSIVFEVEHKDEKKVFYVRENNYSFLKQIKTLGKLIGMLVRVSRKGSKKSDTRYSIEELQTADDAVKEVADIVK